MGNEASDRSSFKRAESSVSSETPASALGLEYAAFAEQHHLKVSNANGKLKYSMQYDGSEHMLFETTADPAGLASADIKLKSLVAQEKKEISDGFGVQFAQAGEVVAHKKDTADSADLPDKVLAREPELFELEGIKSALEKSGLSSKAADGKTGVKFYALSDRPIAQLNSLATFQIDKDARPSVYLWPLFRSIDIATEKDRTAEANKFAFTDGRRPESVEGAIIHELGHHQFMKLGFDPKASSDKTSAEVRQSQLFERMGWKPRLDERNSDYSWLLQGKSKDDDGHLATFLPSFSGMSYQFDRWRQIGGPTNAQGKTVPADKMQVLNEQQMVDEARVKPPTSYFELPEEEYAEAVRMYRMTDDSRKALKENSPELFALMQDSEQKELDLLSTNHRAQIAILEETGAER